jgi:VIT1/CCC1 family predicted Fe2+/Mn2+ transporter
MRHTERHRTQRVGWLRAAVLGANDGIVSTASLIVGVAAAEASRSSVPVAGMAGLVAGAMSMAAGEYVSVSSQAAHAGCSSIGKSVARVTFWSALAMALTAAVGALFGATL